MKNLDEVNQAATLHTSRALSLLMGASVSAEINSIDFQRVEKLAASRYPEELGVGIYLPVRGDINGAALLVLPPVSAFDLSDILAKRPLGTTTSLSELDKSALEEVANIVCGSYLTVLSNEMQVRLIEDIPNLRMDMTGALINQIIADLTKDAELVLAVEITFRVATFKASLYLTFFFKTATVESGSEQAGRSWTLK